MINPQSAALYPHSKDGGNSINRLFGVSWENHKDLGRYAATSPGDVFSYYKFAIVGESLERIFSDYNYQKKRARPRYEALPL